MLRAERKSQRRLISLGLLTQAGYLLMGYSGTSLPLRVGVQLALFVLYVAAIQEACREPLARRQVQALLGLGVLFRITLLFQAPFYSGDLYRYLWDGHVQMVGHLNPYRYAPADPILAPLHNSIHPLVNHPEIPTLYPPVSEILFAAAAMAGGSVAGVKALLLCFDLAQLFLLRAMLRGGGLSPGRILIYAWSPLVITEVAGNGHVDAAAIFFLILGIHLIIVARPGLSTLPLGLAVGAKILPLLTFPLLARRIPRKFWLLPFAFIGAFYLPYLGAGRGLVSGLVEYAERWQHNDSLFRILLRCLEGLNPTPSLKAIVGSLQTSLGDPSWIPLLYRYVYPVYLARLGVVLALGGTATYLVWRKVPPLRGCYVIFCVMIILSPTVHPWYLLWLMPFLPFFPSRAWILLTGLVPLSYLDPGPVVNGTTTLAWVRWAQYLPFFSLMIWDEIRSWRGATATLFGLQPYSEPKAGPSSDEISALPAAPAGPPTLPL
jgi:glycosyl transferase family 87